MKTFFSYAFHLTTKILKYLSLVLIGLIILAGIIIAVTYKDLKDTAFSGLAGKDDLRTALEAAKNQNWGEALVNSQNANLKFTSALTSLNRVRTKPVVKKIPTLEKQVNDLEYLLKTAEILSRSFERSITLVQELDKIRSGAVSKNFSDLAPADKIKFLKLIYESEPELNGLKANLDLAILNLDKINRLGILWPIYSQISDVRAELNQASYLLTKTIPMTKLLPVLAGYPEDSRFLLIMQNNDELRPTGGFIGVYGLLVSRQGEIVSLVTDDSYHVDMPAVGKWKMAAPGPIKKYLKVENWYFRDANWSPDWPTAAKKIEEIYRGETAAIGADAPPLTGVIGITPDLVADLLRLVGPINVKGETYDSNNFQPLLQYNVEVAYKDKNISSWDRKEIINDLVAELKLRLFTLSSNKWPELLKIVDQNIAAKNIQIAFNNPRSEKIIKSLGASGEIKPSPADYLMVVDANLGAFKSDAVIKKNLHYSLNLAGNTLNSEVKLDYRHEGGYDWRTTRYRSYTRLYTPLGSKLISLSGLEEADSDLTITDDRELNKTVFGFFWTIDPGTAKTISLKYQLPSKIKTATDLSGRYDFYLQKQAGSRVTAKINLNYGANSLNAQNNLLTDQTLTLYLNR